MENEHSIAFEMLQEIKKSNKRWFIIALVELAIIVSMVVGYFVYESQFEIDAQSNAETYQYVDDTNMDNSTLNQHLGE